MKTRDLALHLLVQLIQLLLLASHLNPRHLDAWRQVEEATQVPLQRFNLALNLVHFILEFDYLAVS